ncbi:hypothetical protein BT96DRAFT_523653 [Gymnopus androsaceus JB14]|uniref:Uncharacterized protein n=1 Tax=Gymnopus androsaceus JB14 TaxID=1447944 RepID=A0A6A4GL25_9AGAR|nr:hypothetical protein BT96DRAFT_523653 [Gymnopus androsaceus JB14]
MASAGGILAVHISGDCARTKDQRQRFNNYPHTSSPNPCFLSRPRPVPLHNTSKTCPRLMRLAFIITRTSRECEYDCLLV